MFIDISFVLKGFAECLVTSSFASFALQHKNPEDYATYCHTDSLCLKRNSREFDSKPKNFCLSTGRNKQTKKLSSTLISYHPSAVKLSMSASGQSQSRSERIET